MEFNTNRDFITSVYQDPSYLRTMEFNGSHGYYSDYFYGNWSKYWKDHMYERPKYVTYLDAQAEWNIGTGIVCVEFFLAFILNAVVVVLILKRGRRNKMSFFVMHLAITDLMMAIFFMLPAMVDRLLDAWIAGHTMCKIVKYLSLTVCYASTFMLIVLSVDRLFAVVAPFSSIRTGVWYQRAFVIAAWTLAAFFAIPDAYFSTLVTIGSIEFCEVRYPPSLMEFMLLAFACVNVFIPAVLITICYTWIVLVLWKRGKGGVRFPSKTVVAGHRIENRKHDSRIITRAKLKSIKITFAGVTVFLLCWSPMTLCMIYDMYARVGPYFFILMALAPLNSVANPCMFLSFNYKMLLRDSTHRHGTAVTKHSPYHETELSNTSRRSASILMNNL